MNKKRLISLFVLSAVVVAAGVIAFEEYMPITTVYSNSLMLKGTPVELAKDADYAIVGTVSDMTPIRVSMSQPGDDDVVFTDVTLTVESDVFGNYDEETINFRILGGEADRLRLVAEDSPKLRLGERLFVLIGEDPENYTFDGKNYLIGQAQGALKVTADGQLVDKYLGDVYNKDLILNQTKQIKNTP